MFKVKKKKNKISNEGMGPKFKVPIMIIYYIVIKCLIVKKN